MSIYNLGRVLPIFKGEYNPTETYENLDVVLYNGSSYVAINTTTNNLPTDENHWVLVALAGTLSPEQIEYVEQQVIEYVQGQGYVIDENYTHTDNNFTNADKAKVNNAVVDPSYVHTDNNFTNADKSKLDSIDMTTKQDTLVSGTNIKTINNQSILGSGNITINQTFATSQTLNEVHIKDETGNDVSGAADVLSAEAGKRLNILSQNTEITLLDAGSPYFVRNLYAAYITKNLRRIDNNAYTTGYKLSLFLLPAGEYQATYLRNSTAEVVYLATISGDSEFTVGGHVDTLLIVGDTASIGEVVPISFSEDTYVVLCNSNTAGQYSNWCKLEQVSENITIVKDKVLELSSSVQELKPTVNTLDNSINVFMSDNETVWQLEHDLDWFTSSSYAYPKIGQYTKIVNEDITFSKVRINRIDDVNADYRIYITNAGIGKTRQCPIGVLENSSATYTLIKEGHITKSGLGFSDIDIQLDNIYTCPSGYQVAIYMASSSYIRIRGVGTGSGNPEGTSNVALICTGSDPFGTSAWANGSVNNNSGYLNVALTLIADSPFAKKDGITETVESIISESLSTMIDSEIATNLDIVIPDTVYAIVGTELNIWNDTVSLSIDKGLHSPMNYQIRWNCSKGLITDRCFRFKPTASDIGNVSCTCYIYDVRGKSVSSKIFTIKVLANNALNSAKNIVYFGDSLGASAATALYDNFHDSNRFGGTIPNMLGTKGTTKHYEAVGGYTWSSYATIGRTGYRIFVSGVSSMSVGAIYSDGSHNFEVYEVNITEGSGNCLLGNYYTNPGTLIMPSGTLTKVSGSGDSTVPYTDAFQESVNPLWNDTTSQLDINQYKQNLVSLGQLSSVDDKIDAVSFQFGINDNNLASNLTTLHTYISDLYDCFVGDNPNCKFIIGLTTSSGNDVNGSGANYGATWNYKSYLENTYKIRKYYLTLLSEFPNLRIATPNLYLDRYYGYGFGTRQISDRYTTTEQYHTNYVHPTTSGYNQMADAYLACYVGVLSE